MSIKTKKILKLKSSFLNQTKDNKFFVPNLEFAYDSLAPIINEETVTIHHDKHHQAYVSKLNEAIKDLPDLQSQSIEQILCDLESIPESVRTSVINNGGGHCNHSLYWSNLTSTEKSGSPTLELSKAIEKTFGGFEKFKTKLSNSAVTTFGSGWGWLTVTPERELKIESTTNQNTPLSHGNIPILVIDVWEHAYYLDYQNRRPDYVNKIFDLLNWENINKRYEEALENPSQ